MTSGRYVNRLEQASRRVCIILCLAMKKFLQMDGAQSAAAFAYYAFFSLFPLIILIVTLASAFIDRDRAGTEVIAYVKEFVPISGEMQSYIFDTISGVINARGQVGIVAFLMLIWAAMQFFITLICATNKAWGDEVSNGWRLPFKGIGFLIITVSLVLLSLTIPVLTNVAKAWLFPVNDFSYWVYALGNYFIPTLVVFFSLSTFYRLAPNRLTGFNEVWVPALCATVLLQVTANFFVIYLQHFSTLNAVYGTFGGIMALLFWIYLSGCIFIFGACLCAAQAQARSIPAETITATT